MAKGVLGRAWRAFQEDAKLPPLMGIISEIRCKACRWGAAAGTGSELPREGCRAGGPGPRRGCGAAGWGIGRPQAPPATARVKAGRHRNAMARTHPTQGRGRLESPLEAVLRAPF